MKDANKTISEVVIMMNNIALEMGVQEKELSRNIQSDFSINATTYYFSNIENYREVLFGIIDYYYQKIRQYKEYYEKFDIYEIKEYIDINYTSEIKISMFTEKYYLSRQYLTKLFKKEFGCGIYDYALKVRMEKARDLINDPKIKIQSIGEMLNYSDNSYFSKAFKNYFKISPSDYRLSILNQQLSKKTENK